MFVAQLTNMPCFWQLRRFIRGITIHQTRHRSLESQSIRITKPNFLFFSYVFSFSIGVCGAASMESWTLRTKSLVYREHESYSGYSGLFSWWDEMEESADLQRGIFYFLCACYALLSFVALVQLIRIQLRVPEYGWTTQKVFHLMNFLVNGLRAVLFGLYKSVFHIKPKTLEIVILDLPGLLFFSTYTLLVLFWAEIYHQARSLPTDKLRPTYYIVNGVVYFMQVSCGVVVIGFYLDIYEIKPESHCCGSCQALLRRLFVMLRRFPIESRGRQKKLYEVGCVTGVCCTCFLIRCFMSALSAFDEDADIDVLDHPILNLIYYMLVEILPSALVLFILRKLPPRRVSDQYHPIR
ncbi:putative virion binding protein [Tripterygium wilfordii]|uniref:Putative virion binding protein n=1 Tax=Tripterygium wilfordii TaxID=458696 RepID=A0A7J7CDC5_TRIWF|nr:putative virion binding protein [Tripterygium wilfordii]